MTLKGPIKVAVDFSDLKRVLKDLENQAHMKKMQKDCEYCQRPMEKNSSEKKGMVSFHCKNCGWEHTEVIPEEH